MSSAIAMMLTAVLVLETAAVVVLATRLLAGRAALGRAGAGLEDTPTGLGTAAAVSVEWPIELEIARSVGADVGVIVIRVGDNDPDPAMAALRAAMRRHERAWRLEHDEVVVAMPVEHPHELVSAAARMSGALASDGFSVRGVGCALASRAAEDFIDTWYDARSRTAPASRYASVAARLSDGSSWSSPAA